MRLGLNIGYSGSTIEGVLPLVEHADRVGIDSVLADVLPAQKQEPEFTKEMILRLIEWINGHDGVRWVTFDEMAQDFARREPARAARPHGSKNR